MRTVPRATSTSPQRSAAKTLVRWTDQGLVHCHRAGFGAHRHYAVAELKAGDVMVQRVPSTPGSIREPPRACLRSFSSTPSRSRPVARSSTPSDRRGALRAGRGRDPPDGGLPGRLPMRIHLITAESPESRRLRGSRLIQFPQLTMPLIVALTPREHDVHHTDEIVERLDLDRSANLVGITAPTPSALHAYEGRVLAPARPGARPRHAVCSSTSSACVDVTSRMWTTRSGESLNRQGARRFLLSHFGQEACIGSISESSTPSSPSRHEAASAQAGSVAEVLRCWAMTGNARPPARRPRRAFAGFSRVRCSPERELMAAVS